MNSALSWNKIVFEKSYMLVKNATHYTGDHDSDQKPLGRLLGFAASATVKVSKRTVADSARCSETLTAYFLIQL